MLTQTDKDILTRLIEGKELPEESSKRIVENNQYFEDQVRNSGLDLMTIYKGIEKLIIVDISLNREHDNPQLIFESLNSTGLELSQADLIRNYILMGLEPQEQNELYQDFWHAKELKEIFQDINALKVDVAYPLLLELYDDYEDKKLDKIQLIDILKLIES